MKYALCIGINAYPRGALAGCVNDAIDWAELLKQRGYQADVMLDRSATLAGILGAIGQLVDIARYGDRVVVTYSGHGTYRDDPTPDEPDYRDEAICPVDCYSIGMLYDDEIADVFAKRRFGVRTLFVSDSCHSGTVNRLLGTAGLPRFIPPEDLPERPKPPTRRGWLPRPTLLLSGCGDSEYSYDARFDDRPNGAMTRYALNTLAALGHVSYSRWHREIRLYLPSMTYPQTPQLDGSWWQRSRAALD